MSGAREEKGEAYMQAIRRRVCSACLDSRDDGSCGLTGRACAIETHLPGVVQAVLGTRSRRMDDYVASLRAQVCNRCEQQTPDGHCALRGATDCALDSYLYLVVEAIEEVDGPLLPAEGKG